MKSGVMWIKCGCLVPIPKTGEAGFIVQCGQGL